MLKTFMQMNLPISRKLKYSILKRVRSHDKGAFVIDYMYCGARMPINMFDGTQRSIYLHDGAEKFMLNFLRDYYAMLPNGGGFVDIGANSGNHAIWMSQYADRVYAFEPQKELHERLSAILKNNTGLVISKFVLLPWVKKTGRIISTTSAGSPVHQALSESRTRMCRGRRSSFVRATKRSTS